MTGAYQNLLECCRALNTS